MKVHQYSEMMKYLTRPKESEYEQVAMTGPFIKGGKKVIDKLIKKGKVKKGEAPKTDVEKVQAQKKSFDQTEKELAKSGQISVKDQTDPSTLSTEELIEFRKTNRAGKGQFTNAEAIIARLENTIKETSPDDETYQYVTTTFPNFIKELKAKPELANNENVWNNLMSDLPADQRFVKYDDGTVDFQVKRPSHTFKLREDLDTDRKGPIAPDDDPNMFDDMFNKMFKEYKDTIPGEEPLTKKKRTLNAEGGVIGEDGMFEGTALGTREGFAEIKRGFGEGKKTGASLVDELNELIEYAINQRKVKGLEKSFTVGGKEYNYIPDLKEISERLKLKRDYFYDYRDQEGLKLTPEKARIKIYNDEIAVRNNNFKATTSSDIAKITGGHAPTIKAGIGKGHIIKPLSKDKLIKNYIGHLIETDAPISDFTSVNIADYIGSGNKVKGAKSNINRQSVTKIMQTNYPGLYNQLYGKVKDFGNLIKGKESLEKIPFSQFIENYDAIRSKAINITENLAQVRTQRNILEGKINLDSRSLAISDAQDNLVKKVNQYLKQNRELIINNPKFREIASFKIKEGKIVPIGSEDEITKRLNNYIDVGFMSTDHKTPKATRQKNVEFPINKQIVPKFTNNAINGMERYIAKNAGLYKTNNTVKQNIDNLINVANSNNFSLNVPKGFSDRVNIGAVQNVAVEGNKLIGYDNQF